MHVQTPIEPYLDRLAEMHQRLCPRQVLGVRIGQRAGELLGLELPRADKRLFAFVEIDGCFADGISVATGCWLGRRTLRLVDTARVAATCVDLESGRATRIWPNPRARMLAMRFAPDAPSLWHAQLVGYQIMPATELLRSMPVAITASSMAAVLGNQHARAVCVACGEDVFSAPEADLTERVLCAGCTGPTYYVRRELTPG
jgi:formylmethanofuran dehydrogenase subunit E